MANAGGFHAINFYTDPFILHGFLRVVGSSQDKPLVVYVEGDGRAYVNRRTPSSDPTPENPMGMRLAMLDPAPNVLYLGRPCQYNDPVEACPMRYWTLERYAPVVVDSMNQALDLAKERIGASKLHLVGYSGGGAIALLLAEKRQDKGDVLSVTTIAGNLDHAFWTELHGVTPLEGSDNPADAAALVGDLPQLHLAGGDDDIVPPAVARSFMKKLPEGAPAELVVVDEATHTCCWPEIWPGMLRRFSGFLRR